MEVLDGMQAEKMEGIMREGDWRGREKRSKQEKTKIYRGIFCKYLTLWQHVACHVGFGRLRGVFGTSDETLNRVVQGLKCTI